LERLSSADLPKTTKFATTKQKAFLSYMGTTFPPGLSHEEAARITNELIKNPPDQARLARWDDEKLRLYPDLFAADLQAKRENRVNELYALVTTEGAECFQNVSKAHCQVLVSYLDVKFPNWDASGRIASRNYFFPAIAEQFPQLVTREWRNKLKYPQAPKVSPELTQLGAPPPARTRRPAASIGIAVALALSVIGGGYWLWRHPQQISVWRQRLPHLWPSAVQPASPAESPTVPEPAPPGPTSLQTPTKLVAELPATTDSDAVKASAESLASAKETSPPSPAGAAKPPVASPMAPPDPADLKALAAAPPPVTGAQAAPKPGTVASKKEVVLTKPVEIRMAYGKVTLRPGAILKIVSREGPFVKVSYLNSVISVPTTSTDLNLAPAP
jgi:hypothetical protein